MSSVGRFFVISLPTNWLLFLPFMHRQQRLFSSEPCWTISAVRSLQDQQWMSLTYLVLSVPVNDCLGNVCRQLFTWMVTCSDVGLIFSEKHKLFGKIITFKAVFSTWIIWFFFFFYDSELFSKRKTMCKTKWTYSLFLLRKNIFCWGHHIFSGIWAGHWSHVSGKRSHNADKVFLFCTLASHVKLRASSNSLHLIRSSAALLCAVRSHMDVILKISQGAG